LNIFNGCAELVSRFPSKAQSSSKKVQKCFCQKQIFQ
jgi:hypothetical protein